MYKQIAENRRRTVFIVIGFVLVIGAIAGVFAWFYRDPWVAVNNLRPNTILFCREHRYDDDRSKGDYQKR